MTRPDLDLVAEVVARHLYPRTRSGSDPRPRAARSITRYRLHSHPLPPEPLPGPVAQHLAHLLSPATLDALHGSATLPAAPLAVSVNTRAGVTPARWIASS